MTVLIIKWKVGYINLARTPENGRRIPVDCSIEAHFCFSHDGHRKGAFSTVVVDCSTIDKEKES